MPRVSNRSRQIRGTRRVAVVTTGCRIGRSPRKRPARAATSERQAWSSRVTRCARAATNRIPERKPRRVATVIVASNKRRPRGTKPARLAMSHTAGYRRRKSAPTATLRSSKAPTAASAAGARPAIDLTAPRDRQVSRPARRVTRSRSFLACTRNPSTALARPATVATKIRPPPSARSASAATRIGPITSRKARAAPVVTCSRRRPEARRCLALATAARSSRTPDYAHVSVWPPQTPIKPMSEAKPVALTGV